jgi:hypothetical protein
MIATGKVELGMGILDVTQSGEEIVQGGVVSAAGYQPIIITATPENTPPQEDNQDEKKNNLLFGWDRTTLIFTFIFAGLLMALVVVSVAKKCTNELPPDKVRRPSNPW